MGDKMGYGNRKGHHDPPLDLRRLLCFNEGTWREVKAVVGWKARGRAAVQLKAQHLEPDLAETLDAGGEDSLDIPLSDLNLGIALLDWWEIERLNRRDTPKTADVLQPIIFGGCPVRHSP